VEQNFEEAVVWFKKAAEQGHEFAQYNLGFCYENGNGVEQDSANAYIWYRKSAEQGCAPGQYMLGQCYEKGIGVPVNIQEAKKWYQKAADQKFEDAMAALLRLEESEESEPDKQAQ
jgi:TPR repeat protein